MHTGLTLSKHSRFGVELWFSQQNHRNRHPKTIMVPYQSFLWGNDGRFQVRAWFGCSHEQMKPNTANMMAHQVKTNYFEVLDCKIVNCDSYSEIKVNVKHSMRMQQICILLALMGHMCGWGRQRGRLRWLGKEVRTMRLGGGRCCWSCCCRLSNYACCVIVYDLKWRSDACDLFTEFCLMFAELCLIVWWKTSREGQTFSIIMMSVFSSPPNELVMFEKQRYFLWYMIVVQCSMFHDVFTVVVFTYSYYFQYGHQLCCSVH